MAYPSNLRQLARIGKLEIVAPTTDTGWATYANGSRLLLPAATNIWTDPQGTAQTLWPADSANTDLTPNQALPVALDASMSTVTKCIKLVNDGTADNVQTANVTVVASTSHRSRLYIYAPTVGGNITITAETGSSLAIGTITEANAGFVSFGAATNTAGGQTTLAYKIAFAGGTASTIYITAVSLVASLVETPHFDGTYASCAWTGTANASTSTRTSSALRYALLGGLTNAAGTVALREVPLYSSSTAIAVNLCDTTTGVNQARIFNQYAAGQRYLSFYDGVSWKDCGGAYVWSANSPLVQVARWGSDLLDLNVGGTDAAQLAYGSATMTAFTQMLFHPLGGVDPISYIGPVLISPTRKSDAWVAAIQASSGAAYADPMRLYREFMVPGDMLMPLTGDAVSYRKVA